VVWESEGLVEGIYGAPSLSVGEHVNLAYGYSKSLVGLLEVDFDCCISTPPTAVK
jgi:hypothetical protein